MSSNEYVMTACKSCRCSIILNYSNSEAADFLQAIRHLDGRDWNGRRLLVERARNVK